MKKMPEILALLNRPWKNIKIYLLLYNNVHQNVALFTLNIIKNSKWLQHKYFGKYSILKVN